MIVWKLYNPKAKEQTKFELGRDDRPVLEITSKYDDGSIVFVERRLSKKEIKHITECLEKMYDNAEEE